MTFIYTLVEGDSEKKVISDVIAPPLTYAGKYIIPMTMPTSKTQKGGAVNYDRLLRNITRLLSQQTDIYVSTFFDLYQLDNSFPRFAESQSINDTHERVQFLEHALHEAIVEATNCRVERFIPHIQPYELEALLFSDVTVFDKVESQWQSHISELQKVRNEFDSPEHINNSYDTAPSKRLDKILTPKYRKTRHAPLLAKQITLEKMEAECEHFKEWLENIRSLTQLS